MHFFKKGGQTGIGKENKGKYTNRREWQRQCGREFFFIILYNYNLSVSNYEILKFGGKLFYVSDHLAKRKLIISYYAISQANIKEPICQFSFTYVLYLFGIQGLFWS